MCQPARAVRVPDSQVQDGVRSSAIYRLRTKVSGLGRSPVLTMDQDSGALSFSVMLAPWLDARDSTSEIALSMSPTPDA
jgi:hypothetical protein